jgi:hypothetical protein
MKSGLKMRFIEFLYLILKLLEDAIEAAEQYRGL